MLDSQPIQRLQINIPNSTEPTGPRSVKPCVKAQILTETARPDILSSCLGCPCEVCMKYREVNLQCPYQALDVRVPVNVVLVTQLVKMSLSEHDTSQML